MIKSLVFLAIFIPSFCFASGGVVGNGGDSVFCKPDSSNGLNGLYSLDYILGQWQLQGTPNFLAEDIFKAPDSYRNNFIRILSLLQQGYPELAKSLNTFYSHLFSSDLGKSLVWKPSPNGLIDLKDEKILSLLPKNCLGNSKTPVLVQTVIREPRGNQIIYNYDPNAVKTLSLKPMQLSFLLFHEWLWQYTSDVSVLRDANLVFHAKDWSIETMDKQMQVLKKMGLFNTGEFWRTVKTQFSFQNGELQIAYDGQVIRPIGKVFNIRLNPREVCASYALIATNDYFLGLYTYYDENNSDGNGPPRYVFSPGEEIIEATLAKPRSYTVVLTKRLQKDPVLVYKINFVAP
jgi:hypothetical protein